MSVQKFTIPAEAGRKEIVFYGYAENINYFLKTPLVPDAAAGASTAQATVKAHSRRQYPGDPTPIGVSGSAREYLVDPSRKTGIALPGYPITVVADMGMPNEERRQWTVVGRIVDIHAFLVGQAAMQVDLYSPRGTRYTIPATTP